LPFYNTNLFKWFYDDLYFTPTYNKAVTYLINLKKWNLFKYNISRRSSQSHSFKNLKVQYYKKAELYYYYYYFLSVIKKHIFYRDFDWFWWIFKHKHDSKSSNIVVKTLQTLNELDVFLMNVIETSRMVISKTVREIETRYICRMSPCGNWTWSKKKVLMTCLLPDNRHVFFSSVNPR